MAWYRYVLPILVKIMSVVPRQSNDYYECSHIRRETICEIVYDRKCVRLRSRKYTHEVLFGSVSQHHNDVIMGAMASQITSLTIVYSTVYSATNQRKYQSSVWLAFLEGIHRWPVNSLHKGPVTRKMFSFDDVKSWYRENVFAIVIQKPDHSRINRGIQWLPPQVINNRGIEYVESMGHCPPPERISTICSISVVVEKGRKLQLYLLYFQKWIEHDMN